MKNKFNKAIIVFIVSVLMVIQLPYSDQTLPMILIPNIHLGGGLLMLSGIIPMAGFIWSFSVFNNSERVKMNGLLFFIIYLAVLIPATTSLLEYTKWPVYRFAQGTSSIEIKDSELSYIFIGDERALTLDLELKGYRNLEEAFKVEVLVEGDESDTKFNTFDKEFNISRGQTKDLIIDLPLEFKDTTAMEDFFDQLYKKDYIIRLYNDESSRDYIRHSGY